jgi:hypothetical protein
MMIPPQRVLDAEGDPVRLTYFHILEWPDYPEYVLGGDLVPLLDFNGDGTWSTPNGQVRAKYVWDVQPAAGQGPFQLLTPWNAKVILVDAEPDLVDAVVRGWDGKYWVTDKGRGRELQGPRPVERTIDDPWTA